MPIAAPALLAVALLSAPIARAQDAADVGVVKDSDTVVVQKLLYPKAYRMEIGLHGGWMAWDPYLTTPNLQASVDRHFSELWSLSAMAGVGYGLKNGTYRELEQVHGVAPYAYRYLASALAGVGWSPIYAKMSFGGSKIIHFDAYAAGRGGVTIERSVIPQGGTALAPTLSGGLGFRFFLGEGSVIRIEARDDILFERRALTQSWHVKQNFDVLIGVTFLTSADVD